MSRWTILSRIAHIARTPVDGVHEIDRLLCVPSSHTVVSMGEMKVTPDLILSEFIPDSASILILPGSDAWTEGELPEVSHALRAVVILARPVAGICAATLAFAHAGLLDNRLRTRSNLT